MKKKNFNCKFPLPRIKKIIQQNEDIGKVSHSIPFLVSKSLEMFLTDIIKKSVAVAQEKDAPKLIPYHLKRCVEADEKYAFLAKLVENVPSTEEGGKGGKSKGAAPAKPKGKKSRKDDAHQYQDDEDDDDEDFQFLDKKVKKD